MTKVLFCVIPERGHVNPYIGPAQALRAAGIEVAFHASADISPQLEAAGLDGFVGERTLMETPHRGAAFAERVRDAAWLRGWIKALLVDAAARDVDPLRAVLGRVRPDVVALDPMIYAGAIACELEGVPWAAISNSLNPALPDGLDSELLRTVASLADARRDLFARYGLAPAFRGCDVLSPHLTIAFATEALVGPVRGVELVGPSLPRELRGDEPRFPWEWLEPDRPLIYASFGSQIYHQPALFRALIEAVRGRDVQLLLSAAELAGSPDLGALPANVLAQRYVPQLEVLKRAAVLVTHGGANSVMEAIAAGVPLLVLPLCNDQFHQVHFVTQARIGRAIDPACLDPERAWEALSALIGDGPERRAMDAVARTYERDGAAESARLLIALAARSRPARGS
jgi:UDP:flavonoid glycosyltransferase YjiC (YdhE family)